MNNNIAIIVVYFGKFPQYFGLWLESARLNSDIDWIIFTDINVNHNIPKNVQIKNLTLNEFNELSTSRLGLDINIKQPYKVCDFKPLYGHIFSNFLQKYTHWGHCDMDMIFGDLNKYLTNDILNEYDKLFEYGHLTIYKNTNEINERYKLENPFIEYRKVLMSNENFGFDEKRGINRIYKYYNFKQFTKNFIADISTKSYKFVINDTNHKNQIFYWENGKLMKAFINTQGEIDTKEYMYIHFQKRKLKMFMKKYEGPFYITNNGFYPKNNAIVDFSYVKGNFIQEILFRYRYYKSKLNGILKTIFILKQTPDSLQKFLLFSKKK